MVGEVTTACSARSPACYGSAENGGPPHITRCNAGVVCIPEADVELPPTESWELSWRNLF